MKKLHQLFGLFFLAFFVGCEKDKPTINGIELNNTTLSLTINSTHQFTVKHTPSNLKAPNYIWTTSDENIVTIDDKGEITAVAVGSVTIMVTTFENKNLFSICKVTVEPIQVEGITLNIKDIELLIDEEETLTYIIAPDDATNKLVTWSSSDNNIATVDNTGKVKAISVGEVQIIVTTSNLLSDLCIVKVQPIKAASIALNKNSLSLEMSDVEMLSVSFTPINTTNKNIIWSSSNESIAEVSSNGEVLGISEGSSVITATSEDGGFVANCSVEVKLKGLSLTKSTINTLPNDSDLIHVLYSTSNNAYLYATWTSSNPSVAKVTGDGDGTNSALIETFNTGTAIITATSADGSKSISCVVFVAEIEDHISIYAAPQSVTSSGGTITYKLGCRITNPLSKTINIDAVVLLNSSNQMLEYAVIEGSSYLVTGSVKAFFSSISFNTDWSTAQSIITNYKVLVQFTYNGEVYQIIQYFNANNIGL